MRLHPNASRLITLIAGATLLATPVASATAQGTEKTSDFKWSDQIAPGHRVRISNLNGKVTVGRASGDRVEVTAVKRWRTGDPGSERRGIHANLAML